MGAATGRRRPGCCADAGPCRNLLRWKTVLTNPGARCQVPGRMSFARICARRRYACPCTFWRCRTHRSSPGAGCTTATPDDSVTLTRATERLTVSPIGHSFCGDGGRATPRACATDTGTENNPSMLDVVARNAPQPTHSVLRMQGHCFWVRQTTSSRPPTASFGTHTS